MARFYAGPANYLALPVHNLRSALPAAGTECMEQKAVCQRGVSAALPDAKAWGHVRLLAFLVVGREQKEDVFLRVGALDYGPVPSVDHPRPWLDFYINPSDAKARRLLQVPALPDSDEWYRDLKHWITHCDKEHSDCQVGRGCTLPKRVLDLGFDGVESLDVVLRETDHHQCSGPYIALSYSWGSGQNLTTTKANIDSHRTRILWEDVPTLFRDVIKVARALSARFLWIDALCIVQDDENDWSQEAQKMGSYYGNAWLTIAADDAPGVSHTIFPPQRNPAMWLDQGPTGNGTPPVLLHRIPTHIDMTDSVVAGSFPSVQLFSRAWALQERLLSRRILHMGPQEVVWECSSTIRCECGRPTDVWFGTPLGSSVPFRERHHKALHSPPETAPRLGDYWEVMLAKYLAMQLSFDDDRLKAIAALAKDFKASDQRRAAPAVEQNGRLRSPPQLGDYVFGLWTQRLPASLLWATTTVPSPHEPPVRNPNFPTWSWASIPGSWLYQTSFSSTHGYMDGIVAKSAVLEVPDEAWDITDRPSASHTSLRRPPRIVVEGAAVAAKCRCIATTTRTMSTGTSTSCKWELSDDMSGGRGSHTVQLDLEPRDDITEISLVCVEIAQSTWGGSTRKTRYHGLLLEPSALFPGYYMRLGTMEATSDWYQANGAIGGKYSII
ncbi:hypothetical protein PG985_013563 [Apiospora marii]|uniref:uncharacterized protein n=1 Tax=Apiospora marii TaxID=335849 RepID=UPI00312E0606